MLKAASIGLRQLPIKTSARWLSSCIGGVRVREKMSEDEINHRRNQNIKRKIYAEYGAVDCYDESFLKLERLASKDFEVLKTLHNDLKTYNRKNGIVPSPLQDPSLWSCGFGGPIPESWKPRKDDTEVIESAQLAVKKYNKRHGSSLEFVSVLSVEIARHLGDNNMVIQARDLSAAGVSIKLNAHCCYRRVCQVLLHQPVSSIKLLHKDERNKTAAGDGAIEALLYANPHNCPLIGRCLGLKTQDLDNNRNSPKLVLKRRYLHHGDSRRSLLNLSLDDDCLRRVAQFALNQRSSTLHVLRVTGAWREKIADRRFLYHIVFEALEDSLGRRFYSAVSANAKGGAAKLVDLVALDSRRHTIK